VGGGGTSNNANEVAPNNNINGQVGLIHSFKKAGGGGNSQ
jgi:hypothetical protein